MQKPIKTDSGIYILEIFLKSSSYLNHKHFKAYRLEKGYYYYVGSAQKNLSSRLTRHLKKSKNNYWHIDYLTTHPHALITKIYIFPQALKNKECEAVQLLLSNKLGVITLPHFGNSDCNQCVSHLLYSASRIAQSQLFSLYQSTVLWIPSLN